MPCGDPNHRYSRVAVVIMYTLKHLLAKYYIMPIIDDIMYIDKAKMKMKPIYKKFERVVQRRQTCPNFAKESQNIIMLSM